MSLLIAIDGNSLLYRAFYAMPDMTAKDGTPTGALHGFLTMLLKVVVERRPAYLAVAFDLPGGTFRHADYPDYKAGRKPPPPDLIAQMERIKPLLAEMGVAVLGVPQFEADDILGTLSRLSERAGVESLLITGDRDTLQLISDATNVLLTKRGVTDTVLLTPAGIREQYGLAPDGMRDLKALMGDASDGIPGIPGIGEKTAMKLLSEYGNLEGVLANADTIPGKTGERVREGADSARLSYKLGTICREVPLEKGLEACAFSPVTLQGGRDSLIALGLRSILQKLPVGADTIRPTEPEPSPTKTTTLRGEEEIIKTLRALGKPAELAVLTQGTYSFAINEREAYTIEQGDSLFDEPITERRFAELILSAFPKAPRILTWDAKHFLHLCADAGKATPEIAFDAQICDYLLSAHRPAENFRALAEERGAPATAAGLFPLRQTLEAELRQSGMETLRDGMELPLRRVLFDMERAGFCVHADTLREIGAQLAARQERLATEIYAQAGEAFNILSPKQLGHILFDKLELKPLRKTKSGYSTDADTLESLRWQSPLVDLVLQYRFASKLKSTYADGLLAKISPVTGRVHTTFQQCVTATGRLSSTEPNLQNIPIRTEEGREIRRAFVAAPGKILVGADYSQIELRLLAHLSNDAGIIAAFRSGEDIHRQTAAEVFGVPPGEVTREQRGAAKAVNFGIIYGISDFGLSQQLGIPKWEAGEYIRAYLERFPGVDAFMKDCVARARAAGYAETLFGRRRLLPELHSANYNTRSFGERVAMNMPVQGAAADIIKLAMVAVANALREENVDAKLILQVHDELILEAAESDADKAAALLQRCMENVTSLQVPIVADVGRGGSWFEV
ncbi:MAG: DNA polymerase I [Clostridiales bacterium]|nr:DNA polymerase I [Clostridiales bacterium]